MRLYPSAPPPGAVLTRRVLLAGTAAGVAGLAGVAELAGVAGCDHPDSRPTPTGSGTRLTKVTYATSFGWFGRDCYVLAAKHLGWFAEEGLDVTVVAGAGTQDLVTKMLAGRVQFCSMDLTGLLLVARRPEVDRLTAVAGIHQRSLTGIITLEGRGISGPRDLQGRTVGDAVGSVNTLLFPAYARLAGINERSVKFVNLPADQLPANLASGTVDAIGQFMVGRPLIEKAAAGRPAVVLPYSDYMSDLVGNVLVTHRTLAKEDPGMVLRFRNALLRGLTFALDHPAEAGRILNRFQPTRDPVVAAKELELMAAYVRPARPGQPLGMIEPVRVEHAIRLLQGASIIPPGLTGEQVVSFDLTPTDTATRRGLDRD